MMMNSFFLPTVEGLGSLQARLRVGVLLVNPPNPWSLWEADHSEHLAARGVTLNLPAAAFGVQVLSVGCLLLLQLPDLAFHLSIRIVHLRHLRRAVNCVLFRSHPI